MSDPRPTALDILGLTEKSFTGSLWDRFSDERNLPIQDVANALIKVAEAHKDRSEPLKIWEAIGVSERGFRRLEQKDRNRLVNAWIYAQDKDRIDAERAAAKEQETAQKRESFYAGVGMSQAQFDALEDTAKANIITAFAAADAQKAQAVAESSAQKWRWSMIAAAISISAIFGSIALTSAFDEPVPDVRFTCGADMPNEECTARMEAFADIIRASKGVPKPE